MTLSHKQFKKVLAHTRKQLVENFEGPGVFEVQGKIDEDGEFDVIVIYHYEDPKEFIGEKELIQFVHERSPVLFENLQLHLFVRRNSTLTKIHQK